MTSEPSRRISSCSSPTALFSRSSDRNELEQTSSARLSVLCASVLIAAAHDERAEPAHLFVQQPDCVVLTIVGSERVGADELGEAFGLVRVGLDRRSA